MKKVLVAMILVAGAIAMTSCGGAEKCPAYTSAPDIEVENLA